MMIIVKVLSHIRAENEYCESVLSPLNKLKDEIYNEMVGYMKETDDEVGKQYFYLGVYYILSL